MKMPRYIQIYEGNSNGEGYFPFSTVEIPQYSNKPPYSKFKNFLLGKVEKPQRRSTCNKAIRALIDNKNGLFIDSERCISCLACLCSRRNPFQILYSDSNDILDGILPFFKQLKESIFGNALFDGNLKQVPKNDTISLRLSSFDQYTSDHEVDNIALWVTIMLQFLASDNNARIGKEIEIAAPLLPRDSRLDACCLSHNKVMVGETKTSLDSLLRENRYRIQIPNYKRVIENLVEEHNTVHGQSKEAIILLIIGGRETDLLPYSHPQCTSLVGGQSRRFYDDICSKNIRFISANLLWIMALYSLVMRKRLCWDLFFSQIFADPNVRGILSGGQVVIQGKQKVLERIHPRVLDLAVQDFS